MQENLLRTITNLMPSLAICGNGKFIIKHGKKLRQKEHGQCDWGLT